MAHLCLDDPIRLSCLAEASERGVAAVVEANVMQVSGVAQRPPRRPPAFHRPGRVDRVSSRFLASRQSQVFNGSRYRWPMTVASIQ